MFNWQIPNLGAGIYLLILWETFWKGIALWKSAKKGDKLWFVAIFVINLLGLISIFYIWKTKQLEDVFLDIKEFIAHKFHFKS